MDIKTKTAVVVITAIAVLLGGMYGLAASDTDECGPFTAKNSDLTVLQDGEPILKERFSVPESFIIMLTGFGTTGMEDGILGISSEGVSTTVVQFTVSFEWSEMCRYMIGIQPSTEEMCDIAVNQNGKDVTEDVCGKWTEPGSAHGRISYRVTVSFDCSEDQAVNVFEYIDPCYGDLSGQAFGYRIVGQDGNGLVTGTLEMTYEDAGDGEYLIGWSYGMSDSSNAFSEDAGGLTVLKDAPWSTDGVFTGFEEIGTLWGPRISDCVISYLDEGLLSLYAADGILYEAVLERGDALIILQLVGSDLLGRCTVPSQTWSYSMRITGSAIVDGTVSEVSGRSDTARLDSTSLYDLISESFEASVGGMPMWDYEELSWSRGGSIIDFGTFQGTETISTVWGDVEAEVFSTEYIGGERTTYIYRGSMPLRMETSWNGLDGSKLTMVYETDSFLIGGEPCGSLDDAASCMERR